MVGKKIRQLWDEFVEAHPQALNVAKNYGSPDNAFDTEVLELWRQVIKDHLVKIEGGPMISQRELGIRLTIGCRLMGGLGRRGS